MLYKKKQEAIELDAEIDTELEAETIRRWNIQSSPR